ncbi:MAG: hypothetical protein R3F61_11125 [Myxococcota bacterium]
MANGPDQARTTTVGEVLGRSKKPESSRGGGLAGLAGQLGNDELMERLQKGNGTRDELLEFLSSRLESMHSAQQAEVDLTNRMDNRFRTALGESQNMKDRPAPKRWIEAAKLYESAAKALCSGQLHRGQALVDQAVKADKRAFEQAEALVQWDKRLEDTGATMDSIPQASADTACTDCPEPEALRLAHEIQEVTENVHKGIKGERRELDPWWMEEEEEEEEEGEGGG